MGPSKITRSVWAGIGALGMAFTGALMVRDAHHPESAEPQGDAVVFTDVADCTVKGFKETACRLSENAARAKRSFLPERMTEAQCDAALYACLREAIRAGDPKAGYLYLRQSDGWIAARHDLKRAVPAYRSRQAGMVVTPSGRSIAIN